jgi:hypothetical protein
MTKKLQRSELVHPMFPTAELGTLALTFQLGTQSERVSFHTLSLEVMSDGRFFGCAPSNSRLIECIRLIGSLTFFYVDAGGRHHAGRAAFRQWPSSAKVHKSYLAKRFFKDDLVPIEVMVDDCALQPIDDIPLIPRT